MEEERAAYSRGIGKAGERISDERKGGKKAERRTTSPSQAAQATLLWSQLTAVPSCVLPVFAPILEEGKVRLKCTRRSLLRISVESNPALSQSVRGMTSRACPVPRVRGTRRAKEEEGEEGERRARLEINKSRCDVGGTRNTLDAGKTHLRVGSHHHLLLACDLHAFLLETNADLHLRAPSSCDNARGFERALDDHQGVVQGPVRGC